jgi:hypothetical protein
VLAVALASVKNRRAGSYKALMTGPREERLPSDLEPIAARLREHRDEADALQLDQLKQRVQASTGRGLAGTGNRKRLVVVSRRLSSLVLAVGVIAAGTVIAVASPSGSNTATPNAAQGQYGGGCPPGTNVHFRWHFSANGSAGPWSGTGPGKCPGSVTIGNAAGGSVTVNPGTTLRVGYDFTVPGNKSTFTVTVTNPQATFMVACASGAKPSSSTFTVTMPTQTYTVTNSSFYPTGDPSSPLSYQGSTVVPAFCGSGQVILKKGGTFTASFS